MKKNRRKSQKKYNHKGRTGRTIRDNPSFNFKIILFFAIMTLVISAPMIYTFLSIIEIYINPEARKAALNSAFYVREMYGTTMGDMTITDVRRSDDDYLITVHEHYHGFIDRSQYDDLVRDYIVRYDPESEQYSIEDVINTE